MTSVTFTLARIAFGASLLIRRQPYLCTVARVTPQLTRHRMPWWQLLRTRTSTYR